MPRPTIRTIALAAGVSNCTVSRALRDDPHLSEATRRRIQKLAVEMGYETNAYVAAWMAYVRSTKAEMPFRGCLAYLNYFTSRLPVTTWDTPRRQLQGAVARASELGYRVEEIFACRDGLSAERVQQILSTRAIKGILLPVSGVLAKIDLPFDSFACAAIGHRITEPPVHYARADHHMMIMTACTELSKLGYRRIGLVMAEDHDSRLELRPSSAYFGWQHRHPGSRIPPLLYKGDLRDEEFLQWRERYQIDGILFFDPSVPAMVARHFPGKIACATLDWHGHPGMAGIDQRHESVGAAAVDTVVHMLNSNIYGLPETPHSTLVEGVWRAGASAPPVLSAGLDLKGKRRAIHGRADGRHAVDGV